MTTSFSQRRVVVTGAAGFLGSHLCERLVELGAYVVGVDNLLTGSLDNLAVLRSCERFELVLQDVTVPYHVAGRIDFVLHLASPAAPRDYLRLPLETLMAGALALHTLQLAASTHARFLLASTSEVYGADVVVPPRPGDEHGNRPDLQHLWSADATRRWPGGSHIHRPSPGPVGHSPSPETEVKPAPCATSPTSWTVCSP